MYFLSGTLCIIAASFQFYIEQYMLRRYGSVLISNFIPALFFITGILCIVYQINVVNKRSNTTPTARANVTSGPVEQPSTKQDR